VLADLGLVGPLQVGAQAVRAVLRYD
jgi:hypothetical protein